MPEKTAIFPELTDHYGNECNNNLKILPADQPGTGGAHHAYQIINVSKQNVELEGDFVEAELNFQNGPIKEVGVNGITEQSLLAVVIDRLRSFQSGPYACRENAIALTNLEQALMWMHQRTRNREARGVEGTHLK